MALARVISTTWRLVWGRWEWIWVECAHYMRQGTWKWKTKTSWGLHSVGNWLKLVHSAPVPVPFPSRMSNKSRVLYGICKVCMICDSSASHWVPLSVQVSCSVLFRIPHVPNQTQNVFNVVLLARIIFDPKEFLLLYINFAQMVPTLIASCLLCRLKYAMWSERIIHEYTVIYPNIHTPRVTIPSRGHC